MAFRLAARLGKGKLLGLMPVNGCPSRMKASAAWEISAISSAENTCVHCSGWFAYSSASQTVGPLMVLGNALYG